MRPFLLSLTCSLVASGAWAQAPAAPPLTPRDVTLRLDPGYPTRPPTNITTPGAAGVVGAVCRVQPTGRLDSCKVMEERPAGAGLGTWLLTTFSHASVGPTAKDGSPTAGRLFAFRSEVRATALTPPARREAGAPKS